MSTLDRALDLLTPGRVLEGLAAHFGQPAPRLEGSAREGVTCDMRPGSEEKDPSLSYKAGDRGPVFRRFGADDFEGGAVAFLESAGIPKREAVGLLISWAGLEDEKPAGQKGKTRRGAGRPAEGPAKKEAPADPQKRPLKLLSLEEARQKLEAFGPLAPSDLAFRLRGLRLLEDPADPSEAAQEVTRRGLWPAVLSGTLRAYALEDGARLPAHSLPGALFFEVRGPDGAAWAVKFRNTDAALSGEEEKTGKRPTRYAYAGKGAGRPAWCARPMREDLPTVLVEGELNAAAVFVMLEAAGFGDAYNVQGVASAGALPHLAHLRAGSAVYIFADMGDKRGEGDSAREVWGTLCAHAGAAVFQLGQTRAGEANPFAYQTALGEWQTGADACEALGNVPAFSSPEAHAAYLGQKLRAALEEAKPYAPAREVQEAEEKKAAKKEQPSSGLEAKARAIASEGQDLPEAHEIPDPEGQGGSFSDEQIKTLLRLDFPTVSADSDTAHAYRLRQMAGEDLAFIPEFGGYGAWNGRQWVAGGKDGPGQVEARRCAQRLGAAMRPEVARLLALYGLLEMAARQEEERSGRDSAQAKKGRAKAEAMEKAYFQHARAAKATEGDTKQKAILSSAQTLYIRPISDFEPKPWVVGFQNGVWDKGRFRPARREDYMLTLAAVDYLPDVDRSEWLEVLARITGGNEDLARTLQDVAGYALSGASSLRLLPWLYGEGGTGKGTFSEMLGTVLGEMAVTISPKHLATDSDRERLGAALFGRRVALCAEAGHARLDAESLKTLSGGDRLAVRRLYAEAFTARPSHVLLMVANDAPRVEAYDDALKDRVLALPFTHPLKEGGKLLGGKRLEEERQDPKSALVLGFAAWAVEGLARVYGSNAVHRAAICKKATRDFWADVDPLRDFWPFLDPSALAVDGVGVSDMRRIYEDWSKDSGARAMSSQKFNKAAASVGLEVVKKTGGRRVWVMGKPDLFPLDGEAMTVRQPEDGEEEGQTWAMDF